MCPAVRIFLHPTPSLATDAKFTAQPRVSRSTTPPKSVMHTTSANSARLKFGMAPVSYERTSILDGPGPQMNRHFLSVCFASALSLLASSTDHRPLAQDANPILALRGRWAGIATLTPASGPTESYKCVATFFPTGDGSSIKQNLRCKSANYQFDGATDLRIAAGKITGRWQDKVNNLDGIINGAVRADGFDILLSGNFFDAKMTVVNSPCQQTLTIVFEEGLPIKTLSALLKKC